MPKFFFDVVDLAGRLEDFSGEDFVDITDARATAIQSARDIIANDVRFGRPLALHRRIDIRNENGKIVTSLSFEDAVPK